ncbi:MAG: ATP-binding protein [Bacilli bacterium]|nr:ATP-binding protein [Bacilli bacterium]
MIGTIIKIENNLIYLKPSINIYEYGNMINKHVVFEGNQKLIGEIININEYMEIKIIGEIINNSFIYSDINKPSFNSKCRLINKEDLDIIFSSNTPDNIKIGTSVLYKNYNINLAINPFFSNHFAILGNTGSGKSYSVARIIQSIYEDSNKIPFRSNIFLFDAYGEYQQAFTNIGNNNPNINTKLYTTNLKEKNIDILTIPFYLLKADDIALLLNVESTKQIQIIEKALKLVKFFKDDNDKLLEQKNDIIARCLLDIIFSGKNVSEVRNKIVSITSKFNTKDINLEINLTKGGWTRSIRQCIFIEPDNKFADIELVINYLEKFTNNSLELTLPDGEIEYNIYNYYDALEFALISEGVFNSDKIFDYANILKIRLNSLINSNYVNYFKYSTYITREQFIKSLLTTNNNRKAQVINFNINYVDDRLAKTLVKIYSKILFDYITTLENRASIPFHIILEEAHRYVQNDTDTEILGYNIFDRITKEGRKFGILLGLISQRPSEISETSISQCSNFLIFKMYHPKDLNFIKSMVQNIDENTINKIKSLHPGTCMIFGNAFKLPVIVNIDMPNPEPLSNNCDIVKTWYINKE